MRFFADIALVSLNHPDMNGAENLSYNGKEPFVISGPGEYEIKGIFIKGFASKSNFGGKEKINTIYSVSLENMNMCFLGALSDINLSSDVKEELGDVDISFCRSAETACSMRQKRKSFPWKLNQRLSSQCIYDAAA